MPRGGWKGKTMLYILPDLDLAKIIGPTPVSTSGLIKNVWQYIKKNCKTEKRVLE